MRSLAALCYARLLVPVFIDGHAGSVIELVLLGDSAHHAAGHAAGDDVVRDVAGDDAARADDAVFADGHARHDRHVGADPDVVLDTLLQLKQL